VGRGVSQWQLTSPIPTHAAYAAVRPGDRYKPCGKAAY